jgi:hypothetical protein
VKIRMIVEGAPLTATLDDNRPARYFAALLPLSLTLEDYSPTEMISDLARRLSIRDVLVRRDCRGQAGTLIGAALCVSW